MIKPVKSWLNARTGLIDGAQGLLESPIAGGPSWTRALEPLFLFLVVVEFLTGVVLSFWYSGSTTDAWASVFYIEEVVPMGSLVRGMHYWGMDALIVVGGLIIAVKLLLGEYKKPREVNWYLAIGILLILLGFSLTGFLLTYDAKGLAANVVETEIMRSAPLVGPLQRELFIGGDQYGNLSITRFYALHAFIFPGLLIALLVGYIAMARKHGYARRFWLTPELHASRTQAYFPGQAFRDICLMFLATAALLVLGEMQGAPLRAPADPSASFDARPEWYFMPLFQLRKVFTGDSEIIATMVLPALGIAYLAALPFLDRKETLSPKKRIQWLAPLGLAGAATLALLVIGIQADMNSDEHQKAMDQADKEAAEAIALAHRGGVPLDPLNLIQNDEVAWGAQIFDEHCASCHSLGDGTSSGPDLAGWGSKAWMHDFLTDPNQQHLYGKTPLACKMMGVEEYGVEDEEDMQALVNGLVASRGKYAPRVPEKSRESMMEVFDDNGCQACHRLEVGDEVLGKVTGVGPDLTHFGSPEWFDDFILFPDANSHYGTLNDMPSFAPKLDRAEREALRAFVFTLDGRRLVPKEKRVVKDVCSAPPEEDTVDAAEGDGGDTTVAAAPASWERGKEVFQAQCSSCHVVGDEGTDTGPELTGWGSEAWVLAFLASPDHARLFGGTDLEEEMPPAMDLGLEDLEDAQLLVRGMLLRRDGTNPAIEEAIAEDVMEVFSDSSCESCHLFAIGTQSMGAEDGDGPVLTGYGSAAWLHGLLQAPDSVAYYGENNSMPSFATLSKEELASLTVYMMSLADQPLPADLAAAAASFEEE